MDHFQVEQRADAVAHTRFAHFHLFAHLVQCHRLVGKKKQAVQMADGHRHPVQIHIFADRFDDALARFLDSFQLIGCDSVDRYHESKFLPSNRLPSLREALTHTSQLYLILYAICN